MAVKRAHIHSLIKKKIRVKSFHPDAGRQEHAELNVYSHLATGGNSLIRTHTFALSPVTRTTPALVLSVRHPARGQGLIDPPNKWSIGAGKRKRVDGCLLQTQRPGPSVGEFCGAVMCSLTPKSRVSVMFARLRTVSCSFMRRLMFFRFVVQVFYCLVRATCARAIKS